MLIVALAAAQLLGLFRPEHLARANAESAFVVGLIAALAGTFAWNFWRLRERSASYFRWTTGPLFDGEAHFLGSPTRRIAIGENHGGAFDLAPRAQYAICVALAFVLALGTLDERAWRRLAHWPETISSMGAEFCPVEAAPVKVANDPNEPGCALIRRAYELGYAKSLGDCGAKKQEGGAATSVCKLRQADEPALHYAWRLLAAAAGRAGGAFERSKMDAASRDLSAKLDRLDVLTDAQAEVMVDTPRASHHVFTNLPDPGGAFDPLTCVDRYRELPHRPPVGDPSRTFEHVLGQLLFETRYEPAAGYCREYRVHWGQPDDVCKRLAADPEAVLRATGALRPVEATLDRYRIAAELHPEKLVLDPEAIVSFQCYLEGAPADGHDGYTFTFGGYPFRAEERRVAAGGHADRYGSIARMLDRHFNYGALLSDAGVESAVTNPNLSTLFSGREYRLSRLWGLSSVDLFLDPEALADHKDVLEVYPYHHHLRNYVQLFRKQYARERGRL
jgi:hypothetical protein